MQVKQKRGSQGCDQLVLMMPELSLALAGFVESCQARAHILLEDQCNRCMAFLVSVLHMSMC